MRSDLFLFSLLVFQLASPASAEVTFDWVVVADPGNACDSQPQGCFGSVAEPYQISKFEVTNAQYAEFLNAVAATDTDFNALYNTNMGSGFGGITRSGTLGSYSYDTIAGREDMPVNYVAFWDATRFVNWLHNGQPNGPRSNSTTEDGAYTLTPSHITTNNVGRNPGADIFVPSENEWYKAAYYDTGAMTYFNYPAGSDSQTTCTIPGATANTANCDLVVFDLTDVGSYTGAASPNGSFDQGGNVTEWSDTINGNPVQARIGRGGSFGFSAASNSVTTRQDSFVPTFEREDIGFRVASPAPTAPFLSPLGMALLSTLLGFTGYRRLRA